MTNKIYEYEGKHYCDKDLSMSDDLYDGDLDFLFFAMQKDGIADEVTYYHMFDGDYYESVSDLIENECEDLVIGEIEDE